MAKLQRSDIQHTVRLGPPRTPSLRKIVEAKVLRYLQLDLGMVVLGTSTGGLEGFSKSHPAVAGGMRFVDVGSRSVSLNRVANSSRAALRLALPPRRELRRSNRSFSYESPTLNVWRVTLIDAGARIQSARRIDGDISIAMEVASRRNCHRGCLTACERPYL